MLSLISAVTRVLKIGRKGVKIRKSEHHKKWHIMLGHGLETAGVVLDAFEIGLIAKLTILIGVSVLCACTFLDLE